MERQFTLQPTGMFGTDEFVSIDLVETGNQKYLTLDQNKEWRLEARLSVSFWANNAQLHDAKQIALKALYAGIYEDVWRLLPQLRRAISDGSKEQAFRIADMMESVILNPEPRS